MNQTAAAHTYQPSKEEWSMIRACIDGDRRAQKTLYDRYCRAMYTLCLRITGDEEEAADALQEAFLGVYRGLDRFSGRSTLGAWIRRIVVRTAWRKAKRKHPVELTDEFPDESLIDWGEHLDVEYLHQAIAALPTGYRTVFTLIEIEGYSHAEVADMLQVSVGTSKSQLFNAKKTLQRQLKAFAPWK